MFFSPLVLCALSASAPELDLEELTELPIEELFEISVTSSTKREQTAAEAPSVISVISEEQIRARNFRSVASALASIPGFYVSTDYTLFDVGVRGISSGLRSGSRGIKVMIDGSPVAFRTDGSQMLGPELIPMSAIERIEVIRGPGSALYGAGAFLGVVNIITKDRQGGAFTGAFTLFKDNPGYDAELTVGHDFGPAAVTFAARLATTDRSGLTVRCEPPHCNQDPNLAERQTQNALSRPISLLLKATLDPDLGNTDLGVLQLLALHRILDSRGGFSDWGLLNYDELVYATGPELRDTGNRVALSNSQLSAEYQTPALADLLVIRAGGLYALGYSLERERLRDTLGYVGPADAFSDTPALFETRPDYGFHSFDFYGALELTLTFEDLFLDNITLRAGADYSLEYVTLVTDASLVPRALAELDLANLGASAQITASLFQRLSLVGGVRFDKHDGATVGQTALARLTNAERDRLCDNETFCYSKVSGRIGAAVQLPAEITVKLLWGSAFKAPPPALLYEDGFLGQLPVTGNPALLPQGVESVELLVGGRFFEDRLQVSANAFRNAIDNKAEATRTGLVIRAENSLPVETFGLEGEIRARFDPVSLFATASYQHSERDIPDGSDQIPDTFGFPSLMWTAGASAEIPWIGTTLSLRSRYIGERVGSFLNRGGDTSRNRYTLPAAFLLDVDLITRAFENLPGYPTRFTASVRNLLGTTYEYPGYQPFYKIDIPGHPRTFFFSFTQAFGWNGGG